jgi:hypothetical protein
MLAIRNRPQVMRSAERTRKKCAQPRSRPTVNTSVGRIGTQAALPAIVFRQRTTFLNCVFTE